MLELRNIIFLLQWGRRSNGRVVFAVSST